MMDDSTSQLIYDVSKGNPGALTVIKELMWFTKWLDMMKWLKGSEYTGSDLWVLYKDEYHQDIHALGKWIEGQL